MVKLRPTSLLDRRRRHGHGDQNDEADRGHETGDGQEGEVLSGHFRQKGRLTLEGTLQRSASGKTLVTIDHRATPKQQKRALRNVSWKIPQTKTKRLRGERGNFG